MKFSIIKLYFKVILLTFFIYLFCGKLLYSQGISDKEAQKILSKTTEALKNLQSVKIKFSLDFLFNRSKSKIKNKKKGSLFFYKGNYRIELDNKTIISDGTTVWSYDAMLNEVVITNPDPETDYLSPTRLLTNFYDKDFLYKLNGQKTIHSKKCFEIELTPFDKSRPFHKIYLYININTSLIEQIKILENTANRIILRINNIKEEKKSVVKKNYIFNAKAYPGVEVIDLR